MAKRLYIGGLLYQVQPGEILDIFEQKGIAMYIFFELKIKDVQYSRSLASTSTCRSTPSPVGIHRTAS
jgi:hypothetical protein